MTRFGILGPALFFLLISPRLASAEPMAGLFCVAQESAEKIASAYNHGGYDEEDAVASALVFERMCVRVDDPIDVAIVYHGKVIGKKVVIGVSRSVKGTPELFGLVDYPEQTGSI
jgi:hypothetical protein